MMCKHANACEIYSLINTIVVWQDTHLNNILHVRECEHLIRQPDRVAQNSPVLHRHVSG